VSDRRESLAEERDLIADERDTIADLRDAIAGQEDVDGRLTHLETENAQLREALASRIVLEQAKGVLAERLDLAPDDAFELMRSAARRARVGLHALAAEVATTRTTPEQINTQIAHSGSS
jgi:hypothetical protein